MTIQKDMIKSLEGFRDTYYQCAAGKDTIGYGHVILDNEDYLKSKKLTKDEADALLDDDLRKFEESVNSLVKVPLNANQYAALVSFIYNVGIGAFERSTLLKLLNDGRYKDIPYQLSRWNKADGSTNKGLVKRREAEIDLWNGNN